VDSTECAFVDCEEEDEIELVGEVCWVHGIGITFVCIALVSSFVSVSFLHFLEIV
jgi:hypothetical protein